MATSNTVEAEDSARPSARSVTAGSGQFVSEPRCKRYPVESAHDQRTPVATDVDQPPGIGPVCRCRRVDDGASVRTC